MALAATLTPNVSMPAVPKSSPGIYRRSCGPVAVVGDSVVFSPRLMEVGQFYCAQLDGQPYLYVRTSEDEIEVYGLAG